MMITPDSKIVLLKNDLELDNKNQITFANKNDQYNYFFNTNEKIEFDKLTYIRKGSYVIVPMNYDDVVKYNYVMYQNTLFSSKWYYAFVGKAEYATHNSTYLYLIPDEWQNYQNQINFLESFVEREHINVAEDIAGANLLPETLEIGEPKVTAQYNISDLEPYYVLAYLGDKLGTETTIKQSGFLYNGILSTVTFIVSNIFGIKNLLPVITHHNQSNQILTVFSVPKVAVKTLMESSTQAYEILEENYTEPPIIKTIENKPTTIDGYTPKNKKLLTYPYTYLALNSPNASQKLYRYENFINNDIQFKFISEINPNPTVAIIPQYYLGENGDSMQNMGTLSGYPTISQRNDYFNTWLAQNSKQLELNLKRTEFNYNIDRNRRNINYASSALQDLVTMNVGHSATSGANYINEDISATKNYELDIADKMAQIEAQKLIPDSATLSGSNATLLGYELIDNNVFCRYSIKRQFAERIDKYFDMFGYLTNRIKVPNINTRINWNYIKTIGINIVAKENSWIPQEALQSIKNMFNNGITLWHNPDTFLDYSQNNRG